MQPIILLGIAIATIALVGTGFLSDGKPWNQFQVWLQNLGWGEQMIMSPISHASIDLEIKKLVNDNNTPQREDDFFDNVIQSCSFHSEESFGAKPAGSGPLLNPGAIICKLLDEHKNAFAEGRIDVPAPGGYVMSSTIFIPIDQCIVNGVVINQPNCLDVQAPIHHVKIVVEDPLYQMK